MSPHGHPVWGRNDRYTVYLGPTTESPAMRLDAEPVRVRGAERSQWKTWSEYFSSSSIPGRERRERRYPAIPDTTPAYRDLFVDVDGRIWVSRYVAAVFVEYSPEERRERQGKPSYEWKEPTTWDVWSPDARYVGTVVMPWSTKLVFARGDRLWAVERGMFDEQYVVQFRMES